MNLRRSSAGGTGRRLATGAAVLAAACALTLLPAAAASAHPLGNFTVNRYDGLVAAPGELRVHHVEDLAEIPATQAKPDVEALGTAGWARRRCADAARGSEVRVDGREVPVTVRSSRARVRPGQAGLDTLRVECGLTAPLPEGKAVNVSFRGAGASSGPGWREVTARGDRMTLAASDVPETSLSRELTRYPQELLSSPADTAAASLRVRTGGPPLAGEGEETEAPAASVLPRGADRWTRALDDLVARHDLTAGFAALALLIAVVLGAMHALAPGHGKTLMAATAAARGGRARLRDVLPMAASVTVTHTLGVVALGLLVTAGSAATPSVVAWLGVASGALVTLAGASLLRRALRNRKAAQGHSHRHGHGHDHSHDHTHEHDHTHGHDHGHGRTHPDGAHDHPGHAHPHAHLHPAEHTHTVEHTHGGRTHTHAVAPTLRGTILLGLAGGLVPSPSAVVVLVGAAALGQAWFGLLLVVAYGVGLALTLTAAGYAVVKAGSGVNRLLARRPRWTARPVVSLMRRSAPLGSAFVVVALGAGLVFRGAASALG
ncbi:MULTISPECIES: sulfite exporter TauE/SafE family protein [unclassified Streptomyces]|uniref:HoxN/HupN/NixA family nickel/cobalt transporter n=1 Tax=unclassified Streptomyces TaxID=2593676 RepID=UPI0005A84082|nr:MULTISPECIES: sulfite exporter TauE/SafE family protein [unclassified Streptomyces]ODA74270.1 Nickel/cobalt efflux system RcnA [Streptomyces sp. AVP053U2]